MRTISMTPIHAEALASSTAIGYCTYFCYV